MCAPTRNAVGKLLPVKLVIDFDDHTLKQGGRALLRIPDGRRIQTSTVMECVYHPAERTCWVRTLNAVYTTDATAVADYQDYVRSIWREFQESCNLDAQDGIDRAVTVRELGTYPAGTEYALIKRDFVDRFGIEVGTFGGDAL